MFYGLYLVVIHNVIFRKTAIKKANKHKHLRAVFPYGALLFWVILAWGGIALSL
jgi:hypothetical protein